jgi:peptidoglycan biosynthesis protein MviN/MurJ (putative lipid II flippase)
LNFLFIRPLENGGPALATSLSAFFNFVSLMIIFRRRYGSINGRQIALSLVKFTVASALLGVVAYAVIQWPGFYEGRLAQKILALTLSIGLAGGMYFVFVLLMGARELRELKDVFRKRGTTPATGSAVAENELP